jgi:DNA mismatch repair protein MutL
MSIRVLPDNLINQIAAGEVVERPSSVVKELVENSIDAGATKIDITLIDGGKNLISISDNGSGMNKKDLLLCVERHATSKLSNDDLFKIQFMGFRGEALPSISSVSRTTITTRTKDSENAWKLEVNNGVKSEIMPAAHPSGTKIEVRDLFYSTPARLKFLKTDRTEIGYCSDIIKRIAMANPHISFSLSDEKGKRLSLNANQGDLFDSRLKRLSNILGKDFADNSVLIEAMRGTVKITGYTSLPTLNRGNSLGQFLFVNNRPVRDKLLLGAIKGAYQDFLAHSRYPLCALFFEVDPIFVDVNVHPAKSEVRFRDAALVRGLLVSAIKNALISAGHKSSNTLSIETLATINKNLDTPQSLQEHTSDVSWNKEIPQYNHIKTKSHLIPELANNYSVKDDYNSKTINSFSKTEEIKEVEAQKFPLGFAKAQFHNTYIISQNKDSILITDQHAAHERIVYEKMKENIEKGGAQTQMLLIPEVVELEDDDIDRLTKSSEELKKLGLTIEEFGNGAIIVRETPALLGECNTKQLIKDLAEDLAEWGENLSLTDKLQHVCATISCHGSIRSGRKLNIDEMNTLLRQMEETPHSGQCNHGRPTYVELKIRDFEKLFGRS